MINEKFFSSLKGNNISTESKALGKESHKNNKPCRGEIGIRG